MEKKKYRLIGKIPPNIRRGCKFESCYFFFSYFFVLCGGALKRGVFINLFMQTILRTKNCGNLVKTAALCYNKAKKEAQQR